MNAVDQEVERDHAVRPRRIGPGRSVLIIFGLMCAIYIPTATYSDWQSVDTAMTAFSAWSLVEKGTLDLSDYRDQVQVNEVATGQTVEIGDRLYTNRFPGAILTGTPFYGIARLLGQSTEAPSLPMGGVAAAVVSSLAIALLHLLFRRLVPPLTATIAAMLFGLSTATWSVSANALWTHGPAQLWLVLGMLAAARGAYLSSGVGWGLAILTRPHLAVVPATVGIGESLQRRRWSPVALTAATSLLGLAAWLLYGRLLFGQWTLTGGYAVKGALEERLASQSALRPFINLWWMVFHPVRGFLLYTPYLLWLIPSMPRAWRTAPTWVRSSALGGVAYLLAQAWVNRWSGGEAFWGYRYPIETLTLAAPLLMVAFGELPSHRRRIVLALVGVAVALQVPGAAFEYFV